MDEVVSASAPMPDSARVELAELFAFFGITGDDREKLKDLAPHAADVADEIIDEFYHHILSFDDVAAKFANDEEIARVKAGQKRYFLELVSSELDAHYVEERRRIGRIHEQANINPALYIGAYAFYLDRLGNLLLEKMKDDPERAFALTLVLQKVAHFDMAMALDTFVDAREKAVERAQREISELPTPVLQLKEGLLLVPVVGTLDAHRARQLTMQLLEGVHRHRARAVVLDINGVSAVDSSVANHLMQTMAAGRLMGATSVLTGLSADVAQSMVKIGFTSDAFNTAGDLQSGIEKAEALLED